MVITIIEDNEIVQYKCIHCQKSKYDYDFKNNTTCLRCYHLINQRNNTDYNKLTLDFQEVEEKEHKVKILTHQEISQLNDKVPWNTKYIRVEELKKYLKNNNFEFENILEDKRGNQ